MSSGGHEQQGFLQGFVTHLLEALLLGIFASIVVVGLSIAGIGKRLEQAGLDLQDSLAILIKAGEAPATEEEGHGDAAAHPEDATHAPQPAPPMVFLDASAEACRALTGEACRHPDDYPPEYLARIVEALQAAGPLAVVLDLNMPEGAVTPGPEHAIPTEARRRGLEELRRALTSGEVPVVVKARPLLEQGLHLVALDPWHPAIEGGALFRADIHLTTASDLHDGIARRILPALAARSQEEGQQSLLPHAALLAALLADARRQEESGAAVGATATARGVIRACFPLAAAEPRPLGRRCGPEGLLACQVYDLLESGGYCTGRVPEHPASLDAVLDRLSGISSSDHGGSAASHGGDGIELEFRLPSLAPLPGAEADQEARRRELRYRYFDRYRYLDLDRLRQGERIRIPPLLLEDTVVIVGSSAAAAKDWHLTPVGPMAGPEVVANGVVYLLDDYAHHLSGAHKSKVWKYTMKFLVKLIYVLVASIVFVAVYYPFLFCWRAGAARVETALTPRLQDGRITRSVILAGRAIWKPLRFCVWAAIFLVGAAAAIVATLRVGIELTRRDIEVGMIVPVAAVLLESFFEEANRVKERWAEGLSGLLFRTRHGPER